MRPRPYTRSVGANVVDINVIVFVIVVSVAIVDVPANVAADIVVVGAAVAVDVALLVMLLLFLLRDTVVALDGVACTNAPNTCVLVLSDGQCTRACVCIARNRRVWCCSSEQRLRLMK